MHYVTWKNGDAVNTIKICVSNQISIILNRI